MPAALLLHVKRKLKMQPYKSKSGKDSGIMRYQVGRIILLCSSKAEKYINIQMQAPELR
jgi:hypothetical protein